MPPAVVRAASVYQVVPTEKLLAPPICKLMVDAVPHRLNDDTTRSLLMTLGMGLPCRYEITPLLTSVPILMCGCVVLTVNRPVLVKLLLLLMGANTVSVAQALFEIVPPLRIAVPVTLVPMVMVAELVNVPPTIEMPFPVTGALVPISMVASLLTTPSE